MHNYKRKVVGICRGQKWGSFSWKATKTRCSSDFQPHVDLKRKDNAEEN